MTKRDPTPEAVFPVGLLLDGRPCLVVGGGKIATRKAKSLIEAGARVTVVSPEVQTELAELAASGQIKHYVRDFAPADVTGQFLVFAATSFEPVNRQVLEECRHHNVLACSVDASWRHGRFLTPATFRNRSVAVSVTTGGRSCRQARIIKDNLARHMDLVESAQLLVLGTSHEQLSVTERERYHLVGSAFTGTGAMLRQVWGLNEFILLNTCNRVELIALAANQHGLEELLRRVLRFDLLPAHAQYCKAGWDAFEHLGLLTAGLLSQSPGENHIVAQLKEALRVATDAGWAGSFMESWVSSALHISKHIREESGSKLGGLEIEDLALQYLLAELPKLRGKRLLIVGGGKIGEGLIRRCAAAGLTCTWCYHVNKPTVPAGLEKQVQLISFNGLRDALGEADVILCALSSSAHVLHQGHAPFFNQEQPVLVLDLGVPRNVAPELQGLNDNVRVVDLDGLKAWQRHGNGELARLLDAGRASVAGHREMYDKLVGDLQGGNAD
jgi:glutamyl-tRNA reductase